jgi:hypothetical protein
MLGEAELITRCRASNRGSPLGSFLQQLEAEVSEQRADVQAILDRLQGVAGGLHGQLKQGATWLAEKLGRFKLNDTLLAYSDLSRLLELEALIAAAQGRVMLWEALEAVAESESPSQTASEGPLAGLNFGERREQSQRHLSDLRAHHRSAALQAITSEPGGDTDAGGSQHA